MAAAETLRGNNWNLSSRYNIGLHPQYGWRELPPPQDPSQNEAYFWLIHGIQRLYVNPDWNFRASVMAASPISADSLDLALVFVNPANDKLSKVPPAPEFLREGVLDEQSESISKLLSGNGRHHFNHWRLIDKPEESTGSLDDYLKGTNRVPFLGAEARYNEMWDPRWQRIYQLPFLRSKTPPRLYQTGVALVEMTLDPIDRAIEATEKRIAGGRQYRREVYNKNSSYLDANERREVYNKNSSYLDANERREQYLRFLRVSHPIDPFG